MSHVHWKGIYPAVLTPFKKDDSIDFQTFEVNTKAQLAAGVNGIILCGSLGEASTLLNSEKNDLLVFVKEVTKDKVPVIMNIAEQSTKVAIQLANEAERS